MQLIKPSLHALEIFNPISENEQMMLDVIRKIPTIPFYQGIENGIFFSACNRRELYKIVNENHYQLTSWLSSYVLSKGYSPSSLDKANRNAAINTIKELTLLAAESGSTHCGIPCGSFLGESTKKEQMEALFDSFCQIHDFIKQFPDTDYTFEPLDRYAHKKMLLGPMDEAAEFFSKLKQTCPKFFIHWDSSHEMLGGMDLSKSIQLASPYLAQIHLCNCVTDRNHPYFGDYHMDVGCAPTYKNWGYLTIEVGAKILRQVASLNIPEGVKGFYCAIEVRSQKGNDLWAKEALVRDFLQKVMDNAGISYRK